MPYGKTHPFIRRGRDFSTFVDGAFGQMLACRKDMQDHPDLVINATAGSLCGPDGKVTAYKTVYKVFDSIDPSVKASYASAVEGRSQRKSIVAHGFRQRRQSLKSDVDGLRHMLHR